MASSAASSDVVQLAVCVVGIFASYLWYGVAQEALYVKQADGTRFGATAFVMLAQCAGNAAVAVAVYALGAAAGYERRRPVKDREGAPRPLLPFASALLAPDVLATSLVYVAAMYSSNEALKYVSYPLQALAKSCKLVPVLLGGMLLLGRRYGWHKYASVALVTAGITAFQFAGDKAAGKGAHAGGGAPAAGGGLFGAALLAFSLAMDGLSGPGQERIKALALTNTQQMLATNVWATAVMAVLALALGQGAPSVAYLAAHPSLVPALGLFTLTSAVGQLFIFYTIRTFDSLVLTTITMTRTFFTIVVSVVVYGHALTAGQWGAVAVVFAGLVLDAGVEEAEKRRKRAAHHAGGEGAKK